MLRQNETEEIITKDSKMSEKLTVKNPITKSEKEELEILLKEIERIRKEGVNFRPDYLYKKP